jgi:pimeloyl-ACP methyl ester carboxylesterase
MKKVYFISGLGGDKRVFSFLDLSFCEPVFIDWIEPLKKESLESYALRLREQIPEKNPVIVGVSFGGMLAAEMAKANPDLKAIIISSNKTANEFPAYLRTGKYFPVYRWIPARIANHSAYAVKWILGRNGKEQKKILLQIIREMDIGFVRWAIYAIMHWKNKEIPENVIHIHGTGDILLPYRKVRADYSIKKGNHVMVMDSPGEVSALLKKLIG